MRRSPELSKQCWIKTTSAADAATGETVEIEQSENTIIPMPELQFTEQVGVRQSLSDLIAVTDAKSTPVASMMKKGEEPIAAVFSWQADAYKDPQFDGVLSNQDAENFDNPASERELLEGRVQKFWRLAKVDDFSENVNTVAGVKKEMARAVTKDLEHIKRDIESAICSDHDSRKQAGSQPNLLRGMGSWIQTGAQTDLPVPESQRPGADQVLTTAVASMTDVDIQDFIQAMYLKSGKAINFMLVCGPTLKRVFTGFTQTQFGSTNTSASIRTFQQNATDKKICQTVDIFEGDCGTLELMLSLFLAKDQSDAVSLRRGYAFDPSMIEMAYKRRARFTTLENKGGGPRGITDAIVGWKNHSPLGMGKIAPSA